jgi:hypothetical protein
MRYVQGWMSDIMHGDAMPGNSDGGLVGFEFEINFSCGIERRSTRNLGLMDVPGKRDFNLWQRDSSRHRIIKLVRVILQASNVSY